MDQDKKQKVLIAILAVAGLGAGSFYWFTRESEATQQVTTDGQTGRRDRKTETTAKKDDGRKERTTKVAETPAAATGRKERETRSESETGGRKTRGARNTENVKKKKITPAA